jgi:hypothetical protein
MSVLLYVAQENAMKNFVPFICGGAAFVVAASAGAADMVTTDFSKIKTINTYAGDATVSLENNPAGCDDGFWMPQSQLEKLKIIEGAAHENSRVKIVGDPAHRWRQVEQRMCLLQTVSREPVTKFGAVADTDGEKPVDVRKVKKEEAKRLDHEAEEQREELIEDLAREEAKPGATGTTTTTGAPPAN